MREQERRLLVVPEQGLGRTLLRHPKRLPSENPERAPVRKQKRRLRRHEDRVQVRTQVQYPEEKLFRLDEQVPMPCQVMGPGRPLLLRPERSPFRVLLLVLGQAPLKGQALAQLSGRRCRRISDRWISDE